MSATSESIQIDPAFLDMNSKEFIDLMEIRDIDGEATEQDEAGATTSGAVELTEEKVAPIANPSNTGTIPYGVLKGTREQLADTRRQLEEATARLHELETVSAKPAAVPLPGHEIEAEIEDVQAQADELETLAASMEEDFPEFGKAVRAITTRFETQLAAMNKRLEAASRVTDQVEREHVKTREEMVSEAIDNNPHLSAWQAEDPEAWQIAVEHDIKLRADPKWANATFADRFAKAVQYTLVDKPDAKQPTSTNQKDSTKESSSADARIAAALEAADHYVPNSLSQIPSGEPPDTNERGNLSVTQLEALMEKSTPDQISLMLSRIG
jgi:hypothetical protein